MERLSKVTKKLLPLFSLLIISNCSIKKEQSEAKMKIEKDSTSILIKDVKAFDVCMVIENVDIYLEEIKDTPRSFINNKANDNCVLALLDSLSLKSINSGKDDYLSALGGICSISDGYVSEYFMEIGIKQFYENFHYLINHLFKSGKNSNCLRQILIEAISFEIYTGGKEKEKKAIEFINRNIREGSFSEEKIQFIKNLQKEIDPSIFN